MSPDALATVKSGILKILPALVEGLGIGLFLMILLIPYWIPTIIAFVRKHPSRGGILTLNFFFGWTFVGWVVSLAWALSDNSARAGQHTDRPWHLLRFDRGYR